MQMRATTSPQVHNSSHIDSPRAGRNQSFHARPRNGRQWRHAAPLRAATAAHRLLLLLRVRGPTGSAGGVPGAEGRSGVGGVGSVGGEGGGSVRNQKSVSLSLKSY